MIITGCLFVSGSAGFQSNILPFNIDQMMGATGDQLSAVVHWNMFGNFTLFCIPIPKVENSVFFPASLIISSFTIITIVITHYIFKHWLDTTPQIGNPI